MSNSGIERKHVTPTFALTQSNLAWLSQLKPYNQIKSVKVTEEQCRYQYFDWPRKEKKTKTTRSITKH